MAVLRLPVPAHWEVAVKAFDLIVFPFVEEERDFSQVDHSLFHWFLEENR